jgi:hypothetical protein
MSSIGRIKGVHIRTVAQNGLGIFNVEGIIHHCSVDQAGTETSNTYDAVITTGARSGSRIEDNRVHATECRYAYNVGNEVSVGGNRVLTNAVTRNYNFNTTTVMSRSYAEPFSYSGELTVVEGVHRLPILFPGRIIAVVATVNTAPTGASVIVDVHKNGTTIFPTTAKPTIAATQFISGRSIPDVTRVVFGDYLTVDIDQIGSTLPGEDLVVNVQFENDLILTGG